MTHLLGTGFSSPHHWECGGGDASAGRHFPAHFSDREREREKEIANTQIPWVNHYGKHHGFSLWAHWLCCTTFLLLNDGAWPEIRGCGQIEVSTSTHCIINSPQKYFVPEGLFRQIPPHKNLDTVPRCSYGLRTGKRAGLEFVCSGELTHPNCLHNRLLLYCGKTLTWSSACLRAWLTGKYEDERGFIEKRLDAHCPAVLVQPLVLVSVTSLDSYNNVWQNRVKWSAYRNTADLDSSFPSSSSCD